MRSGSRADAAAPAGSGRVDIEQRLQTDERRLRLEDVGRRQLVAVPEHRDAATDGEPRTETRTDPRGRPKHDDPRAMRWRARKWRLRLPGRPGSSTSRRSRHRSASPRRRRSAAAETGMRRRRPARRRARRCSSPLLSTRFVNLPRALHRREARDRTPALRAMPGRQGSTTAPPPASRRARCRHWPSRHPARRTRRDRRRRSAPPPGCS